MGDWSELSLKDQLFLKVYPWRRIEPVPWAALTKPLSECRLALVSSAGFIAPGQAPFDKRVRGGDVSFRVIPADLPPRELREFHRSESFDHQGMESDPNLAFPIERVLELAESGRIGSVNKRHLSFMGSITAPGRLIKQTAPEAAQWLVDDAVDIALLAPV
jgi:D-proline reductase (dithiol) PrdB